MNVSTSITFKVKELQEDNVLISDKDDLENKLKTLVLDGVEKLQVIADFDSTLTKSVVDGKPTLHTLDIFSSTKTLSQVYRDGCAALFAKYDPLVNNPDLTDQQRQLLLDQWWADHETLTIEENFSVADVKDSTDSINTPLRDGCKKLLFLLSQHGVPIVVVSAGLGEIIGHVLQEFKPKIVSNFMRFDNNGKFLGFTKPTVSVYNKNKLPFTVEESRHNVILLGDSLGDCSMADNVANTKTVLKVGFLTDGGDEKREKYRSCYDLVLVNDQTMNTVTAIVRMVVGLT